MQEAAGVDRVVAKIVNASIIINYHARTDFSRSNLYHESKSEILRRIE